MINNNLISKKTNKIYKIDFYAILYLIMVYTFTVISNDASKIVYILYFVLALPFIFSVDKFAIVCFILSTMSYYFVGADEAVFSIYSILAFLLIFNFFINKKIKKVNIVPIIFLVFAIILSYYYSSFSYKNGMFAMIYNMIIMIIIVLMLDIKEQTVTKFLPMLAGVQIIAFIIILLINGYYDGFGLTVSSQVNHNTFGKAVAILSVILFIKVKFSKSHSITSLILWIVSLVLTLVSGSRNALLATILTTIIIYIIVEKQKGNQIKGVVKLLLIATIALFLVVIILPQIGFDLSRYDYVSLISSGGSNRSTIWKELTPVIWKNYRWFGYGPGHYCSTQIMKPLINKVYSHTHNTFFEAWGELGFFGLIPFIWLLVRAIRGCLRHIKNKTPYLVWSALLIEFLIIGMGESLFANMELWILIGFILNLRKEEKIKYADDLNI